MVGSSLIEAAFCIIRHFSEPNAGSSLSASDASRLSTLSVSEIGKLAKYFVCFLDHGWQALATRAIVADDDASASDSRLYATGVGAGYQIERNGIVIHVHEFPPGSRGEPSEGHRAIGSGR